ncbi:MULTISPECIES: hypothetical protein [Nocardiaceae]|nr:MULTISPECIES: hypothetical protein [Rhodococcus]
MPRQYPPEFRKRAVRMVETVLESDAELSEFGLPDQHHRMLFHH